MPLIWILLHLNNINRDYFLFYFYFIKMISFFWHYIPLRIPASIFSFTGCTVLKFHGILSETRTYIAPFKFFFDARISHHIFLRDCKKQHQQAQHHLEDWFEIMIFTCLSAGIPTCFLRYHLHCMIISQRKIVHSLMHNKQKKKNDEYFVSF